MCLKREPEEFGKQITTAICPDFQTFYSFLFLYMKHICIYPGETTQKFYMITASNSKPRILE